MVNTNSFIEGHWSNVKTGSGHSNNNIVQFFSVHSQDSGNNVVASVNETRTIEIITESDVRFDKETLEELFKTIQLEGSLCTTNHWSGLKGSGISIPLVCGIAVVRLIFSPIIGIFIVKGALHLGLVHADPLYPKFALPPAMNIGTITQLFGAGTTPPLHVIQDSASLVGYSLYAIYHIAC
nr:protein PIN-LIKES 3-like [Tanacetum cinerariifolium]